MVEDENPAIANRAKGEVVPTPRLPVIVDVAVEVAEKVAKIGDEEAETWKKWSVPAETILSEAYPSPPDEKV